jgi:hypothetical protein
MMNIAIIGLQINKQMRKRRFNLLSQRVLRMVKASKAHQMLHLIRSRKCKKRKRRKLRKLRQKIRTFKSLTIIKCNKITVISKVQHPAQPINSCKAQGVSK